MFSEYASRFLSQSQSRLSNLGGPSDGNDPSSRQPSDTPSRFSRQPARFSYQSRLGNPYQPSQSRFGGFGSRYNTSPDAPLFHSAVNEFRDDDDEDDVREAADFRALQHSRRVFVSGRMDDSSASENDASRASLDQSGERDSRLYDDRDRPMGIKSSWNGESSFKGRQAKRKSKEEQPTAGAPKNTRHNSDSDESGKMVDVGLESTVMDNSVPEDLLVETPIDSSPPAFQQFKSTKGSSKGAASRAHSNLERDHRLMRQAIAEEDEDEEGEVTEQSRDIPAPPQPRLYGEIFVHDQFFAWLYLIAFASLIATFVLVLLHTSAPGGKIGDTIYTTLKSSFYLLAVDTLVSVVVALVWMAALKSFMQPLVFLILFGVPIVLFSFSVYPIVSSFQGPDHGSRLQDVVMRAVEMLDFSSRILAANPALVLLGFGTLAFVVGWTWVWLWMFTRIFLGGYFSKKLSAFVIGTATWWLAVFFFLMYVWTLSVVSGVVRATTGGTVSNWYFHRNLQTLASSNDIVKGALGHSTTTVFGTICASTLLSLAVRLPILVLPRRISGIFEFIGWKLAPRPVTVLTNPLAVTYASIHSLPLMESASQLSRIQFLATGPTTTLTPSAFSRRNQTASLMPYRMAKLLLHAARFVMSTALGFAAWVMTARQLRVQVPDSTSIKGSAYAYVVGIVASMIGWGVLGAMEGILSGILDGVLICYASERRLERATYCVEAAKLFEDRRYERDMKAVSTMGLDLLAEKTQSSEESQTTASVAGDATIDTGVGQSDVWEVMFEADAGCGWDDFAVTDYYSTEDDVTNEDNIKNGDWLLIDHKNAPHKQSAPESLNEEMKKLDLSSNGTNTPARSQLGGKGKHLHDSQASARPARKPCEYLTQWYESASAQVMKTDPCKPVRSAPATQSWKAMFPVEMDARTALAKYTNATTSRPSTSDPKRMADERSSINPLAARIPKTGVRKTKITKSQEDVPLQVNKLNRQEEPPAGRTKAHFEMPYRYYTY
ncbi:hypothetical protein E0Z10_g10788 [Xylaria hypoxylon]|uniref:Ctl transporter n=1 Tax=Xylaria hypoxylon TaxID=37992 RepID=A0A4Z0YJP9_9PEZI|nr:hypothetical protein E0Z10_g10788 [Xylaria hypoxylon]